MKKVLLLTAILFSMLSLYAQTITPIANIQDSISYYNNRTVTIQGVVTIGSGLLHNSQLKAYIQDDSGRGIMLFDYNINNNYSNNIVRRNLLKVTGTVTEHQGITEITNFTFEPLDQGLSLPVIDLSITEAQNYQYWEGTLVRVEGVLTEDPYYVGGANITLKDEQNKRLAFRVWDTTGIDYSRLKVGIPVEAMGVVSPYNNASQVLPAYQTDFKILITEPQIHNVQISPQNPFVDQEISITAEIVDYDGNIAEAKLYYRLGDETEFDNIIDMTKTSGNNYAAKLPAFNTISDDEGEYILYIEAVDNEDNFVRSQMHNVKALKRRPIITGIRFNNAPEAEEELIVLANVTDTDGYIKEVTLLYSTKKNSFHEIEMDSIAVNTYEARIPGQKSGDIVNIKVWAMDDSLLVSEKDTFDNGEPARFIYPVKEHKAVLKISPKVYNIYNGDDIEIAYFGKIGDKAIIRIYNGAGKLIATPINTILSNADGINFYKWNGKNKDFQHVEPGIYICHLEITDRATGNKNTAQAPIVIGMKLK